MLFIIIAHTFKSMRKRYAFNTKKATRASLQRWRETMKNQKPMNKNPLEKISYAVSQWKCLGV